MPKKILVESAIHQLVRAAERRVARLDSAADDLTKFIQSWTLEDLGQKKLLVRWTYPSSGEYQIDFLKAKFYQGNNPDLGKSEGDEIQKHNQEFFDSLAEEIFKARNPSEH